jgi:ABC-2 type transport system ATP-binding protein
VTAAISVRGLQKSYGDVTALGGVDFEVPSGSIFGLVGPNGAGKTTLIRVLVGALRPDSGSVLVVGVNPVDNRHEARTRVGYMPQMPVLYSDLTAAENVRFFYRGHFRDDVEEAVRRSLGFANLVEHSGRIVHTLSGGLQQRVSLAVALSHQPDVLLLDEPTAGVDPELRHAFWQGFRRLAANGVTVLISTHQMDEVIHCDRVALLRRGRILTEATPAALIGSGGARINVYRGDESYQHRVADPAVDLPQLLRSLGLDIDVTRIEVEVPTLEEVILDLVDNDGSSQTG